MFSNIGPDLTIPPGGSLTPGSGSIYIGGPALPPELVAMGVTAAVVGYSVPGTEANTLKYWFIADIPGYGWGRGEVNQDGSVNLVELLVVNSVAPYKPSMLLNLAYMDIASGNGVDFHKPAVATEYARISGLGVAPAIGAINSTTIDTAWITSSVATVSVLIPGVGAYTNCTLKAAWRVTIDRIVELRGFLVLSALLPAGSDYMTFKLPAEAPAIDMDGVVADGPSFAGHAAGGATNAVIAGLADPSTSPPTVYLFTNSCPANTYLFYFSITYTQAKP